MASRARTKSAAARSPSPEPARRGKNQLAPADASDHIQDEDSSAISGGDVLIVLGLLLSFFFALCRPQYASFFALISPCTLVTAGIHASLGNASSASGMGTPVWAAVGVAWGSLFVLTSVLVAAYIVDALPDSVTGMFKVSQVMTPVSEERVHRFLDVASALLFLFFFPAQHPGDEFIPGVRRVQPSTISLVFGLLIATAVGLSAILSFVCTSDGCVDILSGPQWEFISTYGVFDIISPLVLVSFVSRAEGRYTPSASVFEGYRPIFKILPYLTLVWALSKLVIGPLLAVRQWGFGGGRRGSGLGISAADEVFPFAMPTVDGGSVDAFLIAIAAVNFFTGDYVERVVALMRGNTALQEVHVERWNAFMQEITDALERVAERLADDGDGEAEALEGDAVDEVAERVKGTIKDVLKKSKDSLPAPETLHLAAAGVLVANVTRHDKRNFDDVAEFLVRALQPLDTTIKANDLPKIFKMASEIKDGAAALSPETRRLLELALTKARKRMNNAYERFKVARERLTEASSGQEEVARAARHKLKDVEKAFSVLSNVRNVNSAQWRDAADAAEEHLDAAMQALAAPLRAAAEAEASRASAIRAALDRFEEWLTRNPSSVERTKAPDAFALRIPRGLAQRPELLWQQVFALLHWRDRERRTVDALAEFLGVAAD